MCKQACTSHCSSARFIFVAFPSLTMKVERVAGPGWARRRSWGRQLPGAPIITTTSHFTSHLTRHMLKPLTRDTRHVSPPTAGCHMAVLVLLLQRTGGCSCRASLCSAAVLQCRGRTGEQPAPGRDNKLTNYTGIMTTRRIGI